GVKGTCITLAKIEKVTHEYSTLLSIHELVHNILINLKEIVLKSKSNSCEIQKTFLSIFGPKKVIVRDIVFPPFVEVIDTTQYVATLTKAIHLDIELKIEKDCGYHTQDSIKSADGTNGSITPKEALYEAFRSLIDLFIPFLHLFAKAYNCPKRVDVHTISDLLNYSQDDLMKIINSKKKSVEQALEILQKRFSIKLPKNKLYFH
ncbi:hypothetical protein CY35_11G045400, partial [Sphagnum magellanicum]